MADPGSTDIPLLELTVEAANVASVKLKICRTMLMAYEYTWHGEKKKSKKLVATMVSSDAASYCLGSMTMQKGDEKELEAAQKQLKVGSTWKFHKIVFTNEKKFYNSAPFKHYLDLRKSQRTFLPLDATIGATMPQPKATCADILSLKSQARIDLMGMVTTCGEARQVETRWGQRWVQDVLVADGSQIPGTKGEEIAEVRISAFFPGTMASKPPSELESLLQLVQSKQPLCLMHLNIKMKEGGYEVTTTEDFYCFPAEGQRAEQLQTQTDNKPRHSLSVQWEEKHYIGMEAQQTTVALLQALLPTTEVDFKHAAEQTLWQINFAVLLRPSVGQTVVTQDKWFSSTRFFPCKCFRSVYPAAAYDSSVFTTAHSHRTCF